MFGTGLYRRGGGPCAIRKFLAGRTIYWLALLSQLLQLHFCSLRYVSQGKALPELMALAT